MNAKEAYEKKIDAELKKLDAQIDLAKAKAESATADAQIEYEEQVEELRERRKEVEKRYEALKASGAQAWRDLQSGVDTALKELENAVSRAITEFG
jgi:hypothetical protein